MDSVSFMVWLGIAIVCAVIAKDKNRNVLGWFILGFLFSIFALIPIICLSKKEIK